MVDQPRSVRHAKPPGSHLALDVRHPPTKRDLKELKVAAVTAGRTTTAGVAVNPGRNWIDTPWTVDPAKLLAFGFSGAERYLCSDYNTGAGSNLPQKRIEYDEAQRFIAAGADLALNWEDSAGEASMGYAHWHDLALRAVDHIHNKLLWPTGHPFVVACSFDSDIGTSLTGAPAESAHGWSDGIRSGGLLPGMYGSAPACNGARTQGHSVMSWITGASSWSHGIAPVDANLFQRGYAVEYGSSADLDVLGTQPMGSYFQVMQGADMPLTAADLAAVRQELIAVLSDPTHSYLQDELAPIKSDAQLARYILHEQVAPAVGDIRLMVKALAGLDPARAAALFTAVKDAVAAGLDPAALAAAAKQGATEGLAGAKFDVSLTGAATAPPTPPA